VHEQLLENNRDCIVITNEVQKRLLGYYSCFESDQANRFLSFDDFKTDSAVLGKKLMLLNRYTRYLSGKELNDLPYYARNISPLNRVVFKSEELDLSIYEMTEFPIPDQAKTPLLFTFNDFENTVLFWKQIDQDISAGIKYAGAKSNRISEYSSTFDYPLDSLQTEDTPDLLVQCKLYCFAEGGTSSKIIVSLENSTGTYFWKALEIDRYIKAYSNWWPVEFNVTIPQKDQKSASRLKVYVWNSDNQKVYIDNFGIKIIEKPVP